jgi:glycyl-tRNA synthetase alpha chain
VDSVFDIIWSRWQEADGRQVTVTYGDVYKENEREFSTYGFEVSDPEMLQRHFREFEEEARRCLAVGLPIPAYDYVLKCSHTFNLLDARGVISVTERTSYIARVRDLARQVAEQYLRVTGEWPADQAGASRAGDGERAAGRGRAAS